jgi:D-sedoheptulose 7-phosphate isomerase
MQRGTENEGARLASPMEFSVLAYFQALTRAIQQIPYSSIQQIIATMMQAFEQGRTIFVFGNGGSAATASHMMCDLNKGAATNGRRLKVMAFTDNVPLLTAWANDTGYEHIFAEQLKNFVQAGDVVFAISGSGNSASIIEGLKAAQEAGAITIGMAGYQGGKMKGLCDICAVVPSDDIQVVEDLHHAIAHSILTAIKTRLCTAPQTVAAGARGVGD